VLAVVNLPFIVVTVARAWKGQFAKHRRIAKWTWSVWLYVAITGPVVYLMLYQLYPADGGAADFAEAQRIHRSGDRAGALSLYESAAKQGHVGASCYAAVIGQTETASAAVRAMLEAHAAEDVSCLTLLGRDLVYTGELDAAIEKLDEAVKRSPEDAFAHASLGFARFRKYDYVDAAASFERAIELDPNVAMYQYNAGYAHYLRGAYAKARPHYEKAIELGLDEETTARVKEDLGIIDGSIWICPMHPDEHGKKGDVCPQCGMALEPVSRGVPSEE
jgi:tetratricopeptide (TPR) repeat protein